MYAKAGALGLTLCVALGLNHAVTAQGNITDTASASTIALLPSGLDGYSVSRSWDQPLSFWGTVREQGAVYSPLGAGAQGDPVQLDYFRETRNTHDGIGCYLIQGAKLYWQTMRTVKTRTGTGVFKVALMGDSEHMRLVAATECFADGCREIADGGAANHMLPWQHWRLKSALSLASGSVVPFSVMIEHPGVAADQLDEAEKDRQLDQAQKELEAELESVMGQLDLTPAQQLAAIR